ncbi:MAG TPA: leucyl/phenylalanyl-tRNA--protein transferase [Abditibacteriaceae bacterium]|jgi:leucyl/phenylalanyl-tRNA--protein transferase
MFPPLDFADDDGLLAVGGNLSPARLRAAYERGIFPWPYDDWPMLWFAPPRRALLFFDEIRLNKRARRALRNSGFTVSFDRDFASAIRGCATPHKDDATWIRADVIAAYEKLHREGDENFRARSVEVWREDELVGGLYGVQMGAYFCGESMFHTQPNASKFALLSVVEELQTRGATWLDCQLMTPFFASLGAREVPRDEFVALLHEVRSKSAVLKNL